MTLPAGVFAALALFLADPWGGGQRPGAAGQPEAIAALGYDHPSDHVNDRGRALVLYVHRTERRLLVVADRDTVRENMDLWSPRVWRMAAERILKPAGCSVTGMAKAPRVIGGYEVSYACPPGVRLRRYTTAN